MDLLYEIKSSLLTILPPSIFDVLDIALLAVLIYYILKFMRQNRAGGLFKGLVVIVAAYLVAKLVHMKALVFLLENAFSIGLIALVILFQPELRRSLENMGQSKLMDFTKGNKPNPWEKPIEEICKACSYFADNSVGALIVIERNEKLGDQIKTGTEFKAEINSLLLENIFFINAPLHDGAVIIQDGEVVAAGCTLPSTSRPELVDKALGSRHKAALGMSENSDAIIIVVSEETSVISIAENRSLTRGLSVEALKMMLTERLMPGAKSKDNSVSEEKANEQKDTGSPDKDIPKSKAPAPVPAPAPAPAKPAEVTFGSGQKATLRIDENTGDITIVVSEEIGVIPIKEFRNLTRGISEDAMKSLLTEQLVSDALKKKKTDSEGDDIPENSGESISTEEDKSGSVEKISPDGEKSGGADKGKEGD